MLTSAERVNDFALKLANVNGRAAIVLGDRIADVATVSDGRFGPDPMSVYRDWDAFVDFARTVTTSTSPLAPADLRNPVPDPGQVFAIGLNYRSHAEESGMAIPDVPAVFTKFPSSLAGPYDNVEVAGHAIDWEAEVVAVIARKREPTAAQRIHLAGRLEDGAGQSFRSLTFSCCPARDVDGRSGRT